MQKTRVAVQWLLAVILVLIAVLGFWFFADTGMAPDFTPVRRLFAPLWPRASCRS